MGMSHTFMEQVMTCLELESMGKSFFLYSFTFLGAKAPLGIASVSE